ncbi:MAG TPA: hypothetical protein DCR57_00785 [Pasteurella multocida]|nr:hypothetical protein [Pasteurella multocida]
MKQIVLKTSLLMTLSSLLVACSGGGSNSNVGNNIAQPINQKVNAQLQDEPKAQQRNQAKSKPNKEPNQFPNQLPNQHYQDMNKAKDSDSFMWKTECISHESCNIDASNPLNMKVYSVQTQELFDYTEKTTETDKIITLNLKNNSGTGYNFTLLTSSQTPIGVYGYRMRADTNNNGRHYDFIYTINKEFENSNILSNFSAHYYKDGGFIYSPLKVSENSENKLIKVGDVDLVYNKGKISGNIYDGTEGADKTNPIFTITGSGNNIILESTKNMSIITPREKGVITAHFIDSAKSANDYKYLLGSGQSYPGGNNIGWVGVLFAERQDKK